MAKKAEQVGVAKAGLDAATTFALAVLAGAFIAVGAVFATNTLAGSSDLPYGVARLLGGLDLLARPDPRRRRRAPSCSPATT